MGTRLINSIKVERGNSIQWLVGAFCVTSFVLIWISSILSPLLLFLAIQFKFFIVAGFIVIISLLAYLPWIHSNQWVRNIYNVYHPYYYNRVSIDFEQDDPPTTAATNDTQQQILYAIHPHGAFCLGWSLLFCLPELRDVRFCFSPVLLATPFFRFFARIVGKPGSASKASMIDYLKRGESLALPPGGFEEATLTCTTKDRVYIKKRFGFIKLCLQYGVAIRPAYVFGERKLFSNIIQGGWKFRLALNHLGIPAVVPWGKLFVPIMARNNHEVSVVVGKIIPLPKIENPTKEQVSEWHEKYVVALTRLFEEYKISAYGDEEGKTAKLELW